MAQITSNTFTINVNRETETPTLTTKTITSNTFTINVNRQTNTEEDLTTKVIIYKGVNELTAVNHIPSVGEYQVTIVSTKNCTAKLKSDNKTIRLLSVSSSAGQINIAINVENVKTYNKTISVASIISNEVVHETIVKQSQLEQNLDGFKMTVSKTYVTQDSLNAVNDKFNDYSTTQQMNSAITQKANEITTSVSETYATQTTTNNMLSQIQQNANSISTKVDVNGVISSINQSSETVAINANKINLNGYVSNDNANWSIDNDGNISAENLNIDGKLSVDTITVNNIDSPKYPGVVTENIKLFIGTSGDDNSELESWTTFATFDALLDKIPKNLNGHEIHIEMSTDITENVEFKGFHGGRIKVLMKGHTLYGYVNSEMCSARIAFYSGYIGDNTNEDNGWGKIHPSKGYPVGDYTTTVSCVDSGSIALYNIDVYGADNYLTGSSSKVGMAAFMWGSIYSNGTSCYGCDIMGRANVGGRIHDVVSWNTAAKYGWYATSGGYITLAGGSHTGGTIKNYQETHAGKVIVVDNTTFVGNTVQTPEAPAPATPTTKTVTYKSNYGDTYRSTVYNNWKKDNSVRQGDYGYGDCSGLWFFGDQFSDLKGKTINKVTIKITRQRGGSYSAVGLVVRTHNYTVRPSGAPTLSSSSYGTLSLATNDTGTLTITDSAVLNGIKNGTIKGFGIRTTYDSAHYAVCSGSVTVKITYTE